MIDILKSLKRQVTLKHIEGDGALLDMGMSRSEVAAFKKDQPLSIAPAFQLRFDKFKAQIMDGDELWYYESNLQPLSGTGGYAIIRNGVVVDSITAWRS